MDRRAALAALQKATVTEAVAAGGLLQPAQSRAFIEKIKDADSFGQAIRVETVGAASGTINKLATAGRIIRAAAENADDGYRAEPTFPTIAYATRKIRLPWEVTEDVFHENIEGEGLESKLVGQMTAQFGLDLSDQDINGDTAAGAGPDQAFLQIDDGLLKIAAALGAGQRIDGATINGGVVTKAHYFSTIKKMPNKYVNQGNLRWIVSPARAIQWMEYLSDRATAGGDAAINQTEGKPTLANAPLGIPFLVVPAFPDNRVILTDPRNLVRVVSWEIRKRKVTGETDFELATRDKRGYIFFIKKDFVIEETEALIDVYGLTAP